MRPTPRTDAICSSLFHDGGPSPVEGWSTSETSAWKIANHARTLERELAEAVAVLLSLEQAYSNKHSPQHRAACLSEAQAFLNKVK